MTSPQRLGRLKVPAAVFAMLLGVTLMLQTENGAYSADFAGHPDEAAHVVTGLMVRDYLAGGALRSPNPLHYADGYYAAYPKVALGHYPPMFYALEGAWLLPWPTGTMVLVFAALLTALAGTVTYFVGCRFLPPWCAALAGLAFCLLPLAQQYTAIVMSDMLVVILSLLATAAFARFQEAPSSRRALGFGILAAAAILTKASGLLLALVPPISLLLGRRLALLKDRRLWLAPVPVCVLAAPWMLLTLKITAEGAEKIPLADYLKTSLPFYAGGMGRVFGAGLLVLALVGVAIAWRRGERGRGGGDGATPQALLALLLGGLAFYVAVPSGVDDRYLLVIAPPVMLFAAWGGWWLATWGLARLDGAWRPRWVGPVLASAVLVAGCLGLAGAFRVPDKRADGFSEALAVVLGEAGDGVRVIASSDARGEGGLIAAAALASESRPDGYTVARGSKQLADVKWLGQDFEMKVEGAEGVRDLLAERFDFVLVDRGVPQRLRRRDHALVEQAVERFPERFQLAASVPGERATPGEHRIDVYRIVGGTAR